MQSTAHHGTTRHSRAAHAGHDTARHRTALRRAVELAKLNGAGACLVCFRLYAAGCDTKKELEPAPTDFSPHLLKAIICAHVLP